MNSRNASKSEGSTEKHASLRGHENAANSGDCVFTHFDADVFNSCTKSAMVTVRGNRMAR